MKITKYLAIALLLVTIGKKTLFASQINPDGTITGPPTIQRTFNRNELVSGGWVTDRHEQGPSLISTFDGPAKIDVPVTVNLAEQAFTVNLPKDIKGSYNQSNGTATINFDHVITTSQSVTPPSVSNPKYKVIGYMPNPKHYAGTRNIAGGQSAQITLWGIPAEGQATKLSTPKKYTAATKTATMDDGSVYVGVVEYSQSVTPPNIAIPAMQAFATIKNPKKTSGMNMGGQSGNITLWGLKITGHRTPIKQTDKNKTIGFFWPESNIAQLSNGQTIVGVMQQQQGNYKNTGAHAMGPVWTRYSSEQLTMLASNYNVTPSSSNVDSAGFGVAKINGQKYLLYGIDLQNSPKTTGPVTALSAQHRPSQHAPSEMLGDEEEPGIELGSSMSSSQAATALYSIQR